jgi:protein gp37
MSEHTGIEWAHHTFNPWVGCTPVSAACDHCYAESWAKRTGHPELWNGERRRTTATNWQQPIKWNRQAAAASMRRRVFPSLCDPFDNQVPARWRHDFWHRIEQTPNLNWLLLTKRPQNIAKMLPDPTTGVNPWGDGWPNVWFGVSAGNQEDANRNIPLLLATPARIHFVSLEPLLGPIDLRQWLHAYGCGCGWGGDNPLDYCNECGWRGNTPVIDGPSGDHVGDCPECKQPLSDYNACPECDGHDGDGMSFGPNHLPKLDLVIVGGETGPKARPMHPDWPRDIRDQCQPAGVPFFFKRHGEWIGVPDLRRLPGGGGPGLGIFDHCPYDQNHEAVRIGTRAAGRDLDDRTWDEMPEIGRRSHREAGSDPVAKRPYQDAATTS